MSPDEVQVFEHIDDGGWRTPIAVDDWGSVGLYLRAAMHYGTWSHDGQDQSQALKVGHDVLVKRPDGSVTTERLKAYSRPVVIGDMGHDYNTTTQVLYIETMVHGEPFRYTKLSALKFKLLPPPKEYRTPSPPILAPAKP